MEDPVSEPITVQDCADGRPDVLPSSSMAASPTEDCSSDTSGYPSGTAEGEDGYCPLFQHAVELIGRRWTGSILKVLGDRSLRFSEIRNAIPGLSDRLLDNRLTELEVEGLVSRSEVSGEVRYNVTEKGLELDSVFAAISTWASDHGCGMAHNQPGRRRC